MANKRKAGIYWVRFNEYWTVAEWCPDGAGLTGYWLCLGQKESYQEGEFDEIANGPIGRGVPLAMYDATKDFLNSLVLHLDAISMAIKQDIDTLPKPPTYETD